MFVTYHFTSQLSVRSDTMSNARLISSDYDSYKGIDTRTLRPTLDKQFAENPPPYTEKGNIPIDFFEDHPSKPTIRILDLCCGLGNFGFYIYKFFERDFCVKVGFFFFFEILTWNSYV